MLMEAYLQTLDKAETMEAAMFVPAHAEAGRDMKELVQYNREKVYEVSEFLVETCIEALTFEKFYRKSLTDMGLT